MNVVVPAVVEAHQELRTQFLSLIDALSTVSGLAGLRADGNDANLLMEQALSVLVEHQDLQQCSIFLLEDGLLHCRVGTSFMEEEVHAMAAGRHDGTRTFRPGEGIIGIAAETGEVQVCDDCLNDARFKNEADKRTQGSLICAPIHFGERVYGVLNIYHPVAFHFQHWHRNLLGVFGHMLGQMLTHHFNREALESVIADRTRQLEQALFEAERLKRRYEELSTVDELTELHNRRFFFAETEAALSRAVRHRHPFCLLIMDLDHFKTINDRFGHPCGDRVLKRMAEILRPFIRDGDILARLGGEEFVLSLPNTAADGAVKLADRIRENLEKTRWTEHDTEFGVTTSIGITCLDHYPATPQANQLDVLMREADRALYYAKFNGRNQVAVYHDIFD